MSERTNIRVEAIVTVEQAAGYEPSKPETRTESRIVNAVVEAIGRVALINQKRMANFLGISESALSGSVELDTGLPYLEFIEQWRLTILRLKREGHKVGGDEMARRLGFSDHSSLWQYLKRKGFLRERPKRDELAIARRIHEEMMAEFKKANGSGMV